MTLVPTVEAEGAYVEPVPGPEYDDVADDCENLPSVPVESLLWLLVATSVRPLADCAAPS